MQKIFLFHGNNDYFIYRKKRELKQNFEKENKSIIEFDGIENPNFNQIRNSLSVQDLFSEKVIVIINEIQDGKKFYKFVEPLTEFLQKEAENIDNEIYIFSRSKLAKTTKLHKLFEKKGLVTEIAPPSDTEMRDVIKKSIDIENDAVELILEFTNKDLFSIKNEVIKLKTLQKDLSKKINLEDIKTFVPNRMDKTLIWGTGHSFLLAALGGNKKEKLKLLQNISEYEQNDIPAMQILYSFYQYVLNGIKLRGLLDKNVSFREALSLGYFFVKEFYNQKSLLNKEKLYELNQNILNIEYEIKIGKYNEFMGVKKLVANL